MAKAPTTAQRQRWGRIAQFGCILRGMLCYGPTEIHHCGTGAGGRKDHDKVLPLCFNHHRGRLGIDGKMKFSKRSWQEKYGTEQELMDKLAKMEADSDPI